MIFLWLVLGGLLGYFVGRYRTLYQINKLRKDGKIEIKIP
jgi:hypothetical protein